MPSSTIRNRVTVTITVKKLDLYSGLYQCLECLSVVFFPHRSDGEVKRFLAADSIHDEGLADESSGSKSNDVAQR